MGDHVWLWPILTLSLTWTVAAGEDSLSPAALNENLIVNGGFEEWVDIKLISDHMRRRPEVANVVRIPEDRWPLQWIPYRVIHQDGPPGSAEIAMDEAVAHGGTRSLRITSQSTKNIVCVEYRTEYPLGTTLVPTPIQPNRRYRLTWWVKGQDVAPGGRGPWLDGLVCFSQRADGTSVRTAADPRDQTKPPVGTFDWQQQKITFTTDAGAIWLAFDLQLRETTGTLWYDDVALRDTGPAVTVETY